MSWREIRAMGLPAVGLWAVVAMPALGQVERSYPAASRAAPAAARESSIKKLSVKEPPSKVEQIASDADPAEREIDDPGTGDRWILMRDAAHPEGPGRMALISPGRAANQFGGAHRTGMESASSTAPVLVIHGGDKVIVEEHTPVVNARLEAVAMGPAAQGRAFRVRLQIGGKVILAVATAPGLAEVAAPIGVSR
jgi:hypothetical protein